MRRIAIVALLAVPLQAESLTAMVERVSALRQKLDIVARESHPLRAALETAEYILTAAQGKAPGVKPRITYRKGKNGKYIRTIHPRLNLPNDLKLAQDFIHSLEAGDDPLAIKTGDMRQAYRSSVDGTLQPYRILVPENFDRSKEYPLVIALHGHTGDENTYPDKYINRATNEHVFQKMGNERGYILVSPRGRGPGVKYLGSSETDVVEVLERVTSLYPVKKDQIFLTGHSSGGMGTWRIGLKYPEKFAGLAAVGSAFPAQPPEILRSLNDENRGKPLMYVQGRRDRLSTQRGAKNLVDAVKPAMPNFIYREFPGGHDALGVVSIATVFDFFDAISDGRELGASDAVTPRIRLPSAPSVPRRVRLARPPSSRNFRRRPSYRSARSARAPSRRSWSPLSNRAATVRERMCKQFCRCA